MKLIDQALESIHEMWDGCHFSNSANGNKRERLTSELWWHTCMMSMLMEQIPMRGKLSKISQQNDAKNPPPSQLFSNVFKCSTSEMFSRTDLVGALPQKTCLWFICREILSFSPLCNYVQILQQQYTKVKSWGSNMYHAHLTRWLRRIQRSNIHSSGL